LAATLVRGSTTHPVETHANFTSGSYTHRNLGNDNPVRGTGNALSVAWRLIGVQNDLDLAAAVDAGNAAWNGQSSSIHYMRSPIAATGNRIGNDGENRIIAGDPVNELEMCCPVAAGVAFSYGRSRHSFNGETFRTITNSDIIIAKSVASQTINQEYFNTSGFAARLPERAGHRSEQGGRSACLSSSSRPSGRKSRIPAGSAPSAISSSLLPVDFRAS